MNKLRAVRSCLAISMLALLAACGGGGGSPGTTKGGGVSGGGSSGGASGGSGGTGTAVAAKYVGTWSRCLATGSTTSERETLALNSTSDTTMVFSDTVIDFNNTTCTGTGASQVTTTGTVLFTGTKTIGAETVDEANITQTNSSIVQKQVLIVRSDHNLYLGITGTGAVLDANGYPSSIDPNGYAPQ